MHQMNLSKLHSKSISLGDIFWLSELYLFGDMLSVALGCDFFRCKTSHYLIRECKQSTFSYYSRPSRPLVQRVRRAGGLDDEAVRPDNTVRRRYIVLATYATGDVI